MDSESPEVKKEFQRWIPLSEIANNSNLLDEVPGTYIMRKLGGKKFGRLARESDIIYIGSTGFRKGNHKNVRSRIREDFILGLPPGETTQRIHKLLRKRDYLNKIEVAWCTKDIEAELLERYEANHDELPPWNRRIEK